jgi:hypothetical protein
MASWKGGGALSLARKSLSSAMIFEKEKSTKFFSPTSFAFHIFVNMSKCFKFSNMLNCNILGWYKHIKSKP